MIKLLRDSNMAIVGGGRFCSTLLELLYSDVFRDQRPSILGVADINEDAAGLTYARELGIATFHDHKAFYRLDDLDLIIELTRDDALIVDILGKKPPGVRLIDHFEAIGVMDALQIEAEKLAALAELRENRSNPDKAEALFEKFAGRVEKIARKTTDYSLRIKRDLVENARAMSQIVQGSMAATFVLNGDHIITHWNRALETLSGWPAEKMVGTNKQWAPFWEKERPSMADVILDQLPEEEIEKLYGKTWRKSALIEGAYEAEVFFPNLGKNGKWCFFTAAPIKTPDGGVVGAIETIWDKTEDRKAEEERKMHNRELAQIIQGSTIPTFVINKDHVVTHWNKALEKFTGHSAREIVGTNQQWKPFRSKKRPIMADVILDQFEAGEINKYYMEWRQSNLIEGAYEAEEFFPNLGENGKWCFFTAAPIKDSDGNIIGAIETLWDTTEARKVVEERERHNRELAQIIQGSTIPTFVINKDHVVTHWNKALEKLTGYSAREIVGTNTQWKAFRSKDHALREKARPLMADAILDQFEAGEISRYYKKWRVSSLIEGAFESEEFFPHFGENGKWCFFTAAPIKDPNGNIIGAIETLWDITEAKKAEQERERRTRELAALCSIYSALNAPEGIDQRIDTAITEIGEFLSAESICLFLQGKDHKFFLKYGYGSSENMCMSHDVANENSIVHRVAREEEIKIFEHLPSDNREEIGLLAIEQLKSLAYIPLSSKDRKGFGVIRIGSRKANQFTAEEKNVLELISNRIAIAIENARLYENYIQSEEKYRSLFNNDPNPIFILDGDTLKIMDTNQRAESCYGYTRKEFLGLPFPGLGSDDDDELTMGLKNLTEDQQVLFSKRRHYKKGRIPFYVNVNVCHTKYRERDVVIAAATDVTESVEKETQLIQASKMATLGLMASGMAHEINQPLNVIQVCADFFLKMIDKGQRIDDDSLQSLANDISDNVQRASGIIRHVRDFARQSEVVKNKVNLNDPIQDVFNVLGHQIKAHSVEAELHLDPDLPCIMAEHNRLEQVFINLVTNAIDAMDEKEAQPVEEGWRKRLTIRSFYENNQVMATVTDTGVGMPDRIIDKIFEPFFTTKEVGRGTGLGVSISYGIVKDYDGKIKIRSQVGKGSTFELLFPALEKGEGK